MVRLAAIIAASAALAVAFSVSQSSAHRSVSARAFADGSALGCASTGTVVTMNGATLRLRIDGGETQTFHNVHVLRMATPAAGSRVAIAGILSTNEWAVMPAE